MSENQKEILFELEKARVLVVSDPHKSEITLRELLKKDHNIREDLQIKISLAYSLFAQTKNNESLNLYEDVLKKAIEHQFQEEIADAMLGKGTCYIHTSNLGESILNCTQAIKIFKNLSLFEKEARANNSLGSLYFSKGEFDKSLECYRNTMTLTKNKETLMYTMALGNSALIYLLRGEMEKTAEFSRLSIKKAKKLN
ncbi:MAG: tetratricopeptide repeat protein, partial [Promethearchaeota archaeon]